MGSSTDTGYSYQQPVRRQRPQDKDIERKKERLSDIQLKIKRFDSPSTENYINPNTARAPNIKHNSPEVKDVCYFAERVRHMRLFYIQTNNHFWIYYNKVLKNGTKYF